MNALTILTLTTMEVFKSANLKSKAYRTAIVQNGGIEMDRYIYEMQSEGIANSHGSFTKRAIPLSGTGIKGSPKPTKPIAKGVKRTTHTPNNKIVHRPHKKIKRAKKWQGL